MHARILVLLLSLALAVLLTAPTVDRDAHRAAGAAGTIGTHGTGGVSAGEVSAGEQVADPATPSAEPVSRDGSGKARRKRRGVNCRKVRCMALTFDDGPGLDTPRLLRVLRRNRVPATFFLVGEMVDVRPETARMIARHGHEIGVHSWNHANLTTLGPKWLAWQVRHTKRRIEQVTGREVTLSRPPYGATNAAVLRAQGEAGLAEVLWNIDTSDWKIRHAGHVRQVAVDRARRNGVVLMHDIRPTTVDAVESMVRALKRRGYRLVTVSDLIGDPQAGTSYFDWAQPQKVVTRKSRGRGSRQAG